MAIERYQTTCEGSCAGRSVAIDCPIIAPIDISHIYIYTYIHIYIYTYIHIYIYHVYICICIYIYIYVYYITLQYIAHFLTYDIYDQYA